MLPPRKSSHPEWRRLEVVELLLQDVLLAPPEPLPDSLHWAQYQTLQVGQLHARTYSSWTRALRKNKEGRIQKLGENPSGSKRAADKGPDPNDLLATFPQKLPFWVQQGTQRGTIYVGSSGYCSTTDRYMRPPQGPMKKNSLLQTMEGLSKLIPVIGAKNPLMARETPSLPASS